MNLCRSCGIMPYYYYGPGGDAFWLAAPRYDSSITITTEQTGNKTTTTISTPIGDLIDQTEFMPSSSSAAHTKFPVENKKEFDVFRYMIEHRVLEPRLIEGYQERRELWSDYDGLPSIAMPRSPLAAFFYEWAGIMNGVYLMTDYPTEIEEIFALMHEQEEPIIEAVCEIAPPLVHFADNMSSDNMAGFYDDLMAAGHRRRLERFHRAGIPCAVHLDGVVRGLIPKLSGIGFDAIEALTPAPGGDMEIEQMREAACSDNVILWGGVPGILFAPPYTWEDMKNHLEKTLETWRGTRFVLGVADQIPPDGDIRFCSRIAERIGYHSFEK